MYIAINDWVQVCDCFGCVFDSDCFQISSAFEFRTRAGSIVNDVLCPFIVLFQLARKFLLCLFCDTTNAQHGWQGVLPRPRLIPSLFVVSAQALSAHPMPPQRTANLSASNWIRFQEKTGKFSFFSFATVRRSFFYVQRLQSTFFVIFLSLHDGSSGLHACLLSLTSTKTIISLFLKRWKTSKRSLCCPRLKGNNEVGSWIHLWWWNCPWSLLMQPKVEPYCFSTQNVDSVF